MRSNRNWRPSKKKKIVYTAQKLGRITSGTDKPGDGRSRRAGQAENVVRPFRKTLRWKGHAVIARCGVPTINLLPYAR
ncbi:unnamed protein product, partial [Nesidiocoris tenuis]